jgi:protein phosphatase
MGDSRAYLLRRSKGRMTRPKEDDTVLGDALSQGVPYAKAARLPNAHALTRMLGALSRVPALPVIRRWEPGDLVVLCTDGLSDQLDSDAIANMVLDAADLHAAAEHLVSRAIEVGGSDNATAVLLHRTA